MNDTEYKREPETGVRSTGLVALKRYRIYRENRRDYLCICAARDAKHALKIARQSFKLGRNTIAIQERSRIDLSATK